MDDNIEYKEFSHELDDDEIVTFVASWIKECEPYHDQLLRAQEKAIEYYKGNQTDLGSVALYNSDAVYNRLYEATETIVPIVTGSAHEFIAIPAEDTPESKERARKTQIVLYEKYRQFGIQSKLEQITRDIILKRFGVLKYYWDDEADEIAIEDKDPRAVYVPKLQCPPDKLPYVMCVEEYNREELLANFPDYDFSQEDTGGLVKKLWSKGQELMTGNRRKEKSYQVLEVWTTKSTVWLHNKQVIRKQANPNYNFKNKKANYLRQPRLGFIFFTLFRTGESPFGDISLAEAGIPVQDDINVIKRNITNNIIKMGNGQIYLDSEVMTEEESDNITSEPGAIIIGKNIASENRIKREPGVPLPNAHFANLQHSEAAFDNIMGVHGATRGAAASKTLGQDIISRQQDFSRVELFTRELNRGVQQLAEGVAQLMKMNYKAGHVERILGRDGSVEFIDFTRQDLEDGQAIVVRDGEPTVLDPIQKANQAVQLWQLGALDPESLYERLGYPNPQKTSEKLQAWRTGQLLLESALGGKQGGGGKEVETPLSSLQRSIEQLGGGGAQLNQPPNA